MMKAARLDEQYIQERIRGLASLKVSIPSKHSYHQSYPDMLELFVGKPITPRLVVQGAHMVYGWMPTILEVNRAELEAAVKVLARIRSSDDEPLSDEDWVQIKKAINNSLVGASKLAHFIAPERVAIWDSNIVKYLVGDGGSRNSAALQSRAARLSTFTAYQAAMRKSRGSAEAVGIARTVKAQLGYRVSQLRALELLMFHS